MVPRFEEFRMAATEKLGEPFLFHTQAERLLADLDMYSGKYLQGYLGRRNARTTASKIGLDARNYGFLSKLF